MDKLIIYPKGTGIVEVYPSGAFSIEETALRDVPTGVKYKIINVSELPSDFRDAWEFDFTTDFDGVGA